jgi:hypothetical protein
MERFRLRVRHQPKRGDLWEIKLFPDRPDHLTREADGRDLGTSTDPVAIHWLRQVARPLLARALRPGPVSAETFGPGSAPCWLQPEDGMRLALAFSAAKYLVVADQRARYQEGLDELPSEVILYWFTLCFYGYRQAAGRLSLRVLLTHEEPRATDRETTSGRTATRPTAAADLPLPVPAGDPGRHQEQGQPVGRAPQGPAEAQVLDDTVGQDGLAATAGTDHAPSRQGDPLPPSVLRAAGGTGTPAATPRRTRRSRAKAAGMGSEQADAVGDPPDTAPQP